MFEVVKEATIRRKASLGEADLRSGPDEVGSMLVNNQAFTDEVLNDVLYEDDADQAGNAITGGYMDVAGAHVFEFLVGDRVSVAKKGLGVVMFAGMHHENGEPRYTHWM